MLTVDNYSLQQGLDPRQQRRVLAANDRLARARAQRREHARDLGLGAVVARQVERLSADLQRE